MKKILKLSILSLILLLLPGSNKTLAQSKIVIEEIRKANQTKQDLDLCQAEKRNLQENFADLLKAFELQTQNVKILTQGLSREVKRKRIWRSIAIGALIVSTIQTVKNVN